MFDYKICDQSQTKIEQEAKLSLG